jgi:protein O-GlcNAc transferase
MVQIREKFELALALHQRGQLEQARTIYEEILEVHPSNFDVLHLLGVIAAQTADPGRAVQLIGRAIEIDSTSADGPPLTDFTGHLRDFSDTAASWSTWIW